jgi:hypothetical protein
VVESSALLKRHTPKGYRGFESLPHRHDRDAVNRSLSQHPPLSRTGDSNSFDCPCLQSLQGVETTSISGQHYCSTSWERNPSLTVFIVFSLVEESNSASRILRSKNHIKNTFADNVDNAEALLFRQPGESLPRRLQCSTRQHFFFFQRNSSQNSQHSTFFLETS